MSDNLKDILSNLSPDIDQETLLLYLQGQLSAEKKHEVEKQLLLNEFEDDAVTGLEEVKDKAQLAYVIEMMNRDLRKKTAMKKKRRDKLKLKDQPWLYISALILILLIVLCYFTLQRMMNKP
jgi:hypothetical protein